MTEPTGTVVPMRRPVIPAVVAVAAVALVLTACAPDAGHPTASAKPTRTAPPSPVASTTPSRPPLPADVLFQITATATAPDGTVADLVEIVHAPVTTTDHQAGDLTQLDAECDSWRQAFSSPQYVVGDVTATVRDGASWSDTDGRIAVDMASYPVWTGDQDPFQAQCASATIHLPGTARAVSPVAGGKPDSDGGWAVFRYGFSTATPGQATPAPSGIVFSRCRVQLSAAAGSSIFASTWASHPETDGGAACRFGGTS